jgi:isoaspartyl peptidase/L-asparaginase-like protein (Ntn-hydrolase superfamily)
MVNANNRDIGRLFREGTTIDAAMNAAVREAVLQHRQKGLPMAVWHDGKVAWIPPEEIDLGPESSSAAPSR